MLRMSCWILFFPSIKPLHISICVWCWIDIHWGQICQFFGSASFYWPSYKKCREAHGSVYKQVNRSCNRVMLRVIASPSAPSPFWDGYVRVCKSFLLKKLAVLCILREYCICILYIVALGWVHVNLYFQTHLNFWNNKNFQTDNNSPCTTGILFKTQSINLKKLQMALGFWWFWRHLWRTSASRRKDTDLASACISCRRTNQPKKRRNIFLTLLFKHSNMMRVELSKLHTIAVHTPQLAYI